MRSTLAAVLAGVSLAHADVEVVLGPQSSSLGTPSSGVSLTFMQHGAKAWGDLTGAEFRSPRPLLEGLPTTVPGSTLPAGSEVKFHCPGNGGYEVCDAWVFFYHCPQSCDAKYQGGVPQQLAADGWQFTLCAPSFVTGVATGYVHQMRSYRMKLQPGQTVSFTTTKDAEFLAFALDPHGADCGAIHDSAACGLRGKGQRCVWDAQDGVCRDTTCRKVSQGPPPPCDECPWHLLDNRCSRRTGWLNRDTPSATGDWETYVDFPSPPCGNDAVLGAECQTAAGADWTTVTSTGDISMPCTKHGFVCQNKPGKQCIDYKVRFICAAPCP